MATPNPARPPKRKRIESGGRSTLSNKFADFSSVSPDGGMQSGTVNSKIQQAKKFSIAQAQQDGCLGSYKSFDSPFGNYLLPVIPTYADLFSEKLACKSNQSLQQP